MELTIQSVNPKIREFAGEKGTWHYIKVMFTDGSQGEASAKPAESEAVQQALTALIGKPGEYVVEDKGMFNDIPQRRIKSWPGKPAPQVGRPPGGMAPAWRNTEEGEKYEQERMDRRTSLMQAVQMCGDDAVGMMLAAADAMYKWLRATASVEAKPAAPVNTPPKPYFPSPANVAPAAPIVEEPAQPRRKAFFELCWQLDMPADTAYILWLVKTLLVALQKWPSHLDIRSVEDVSEDMWGFAKTAIRSYHDKALRHGFVCGEEPEFRNQIVEGVI